MARRFAGWQRHFTGEHVWAWDYFVSTVGLDEALVRAYRGRVLRPDEAWGRPAALGGSWFLSAFEALT
jgi:putative transposase